MAGLDIFPIPDGALMEDRLGVVGTAGSGKTYSVTTAIERIMGFGGRVVAVDPLDVMWGLRLAANGKTASDFKPAIFGGSHGDLPLTENAGGVIGEAVATMAESCIVSLGDLKTKASQRRFMLAFLEALYRHTKGQPYHLILDEADLWAPQRPLDRDPVQSKLQSVVEEIVRRGRVRGFVPWLITQRPAVISKDVLSQIDGLVSFKLTSSQDRAALWAWISGQADEIEGKRILGELPTMQRGEAIVWLPGRAITRRAVFPAKATFDSSRTPKRGETPADVKLKPLDLAALRKTLAAVEAETKANDPAALRRRIAELEASAKKAAPSADPEALRAERIAGYTDGLRLGLYQGETRIARAIADLIEPTLHQKQPPGLESLRKPVQTRKPSAAPETAARRRSLPSAATPAADNGDLKEADQRIADAVAWWNFIGAEPAVRDLVAIVAGFSPNSSTTRARMRHAIDAGVIEGAGMGMIRLTPAGSAIAEHPTAASLDELKALAVRLIRRDDVPLFEALYELAGEPISRSAAAVRANLSPDSSTTRARFSRLTSLGVARASGPGEIAAAPWLFRVPS